MGTEMLANLAKNGEFGENGKISPRLLAKW